VGRGTWWKWIALAAAACALALLALGWAGGRLLSGAMAPSVRAGDPAPRAVFLGLDGKEVSLKDLRGKVVVLDFWASW
jgi:thiol-disulfide isomerase/thioredoxin